MYTYHTEVKYSETDSDAKMTLGAMLDNIQDCSVMHVTERGMPTMRLKDEFKQAWIVNSWQIVINSRPKLGDKIGVSTIPYGFKGGCGFRNFTISDENGNNYVECNSVWTLLNTETLSPMRVSEQAKLNVEIDEKLDMDYADRKIALPEDGFENVGTIEVRKYHLDTNNHVNNARYIDMALEYVEPGMDIRQVRIQYNIPAIFGDNIQVRKCVNGKYTYILLEKETGELFVAFEIEER